MSLAIIETSPFDSIRHTDQHEEYWFARELMPLLGYSRWNEYKPVIERAIASCRNIGNTVTEHFSGCTRHNQHSKVGRNQQDWKLSRYGAYLLAMNGDPRKLEIASAQAYFVAKTREAETVIPQQSDRLRELEMQLELARTQERLSNSQHKLLATVHLLETVAPGLAPLALGRPDAIITRNEYIERTITNAGTFEGVGITYIQRRFGFKSTKAAWDWLDSIGYGKDSGFWESQPALVHTPRLTPEHLEAIKTKFARKEGNRQMIFGE